MFLTFLKSGFEKNCNDTQSNLHVRPLAKSDRQSKTPKFSLSQILTVGASPVSDNDHVLGLTAMIFHCFKPLVSDYLTHSLISMCTIYATWNTYILYCYLPKGAFQEQ